MEPVKMLVWWLAGIGAFLFSLYIVFLYSDRRK